MKKYFGLLILLPVFSFAQQNGFVVNGDVKGVTDKSPVYIVDANNPGDTISKSMVTNGNFKLSGKLTEPGLYNLEFGGVGKKGLLFLDNSQVSVSGNSDDIQKLKVEGSDSHRDFQEFQNVFNPLFANLNKLSDQAKSAGMTNGLKADIDKTTADIQKTVDKFLKDKKGSYVTPFLVLVTAQLSENPEIVEARYTALGAPLQQSFYGKYVKNMLDETRFGAVGTAALDFTQNDTQGKPISLSSFKGKYVLIDFWASWCGPCRQENPNVVTNYNNFKDKNFTVLGISLDRSKDAWLKAIKDDKLAWTHVSDLKFWSNEVAVKYKVQSIPQNYLIDPTGKIIGKNLRGYELTEKLKELLK